MSAKARGFRTASPRGETAHRASGFTVIELMISLIILAIIVGVGAPGLMSFLTQSRMTGQINELLADISYARNEAATRGIRVGFCASTNAGTATANCSGSAGDWGTGRIVFIDVNGDGQRDTGGSSTELLLRNTPALTGGSTLAISQTGASAGPPSFLFRPYGGIATPASGGTTYSSISGAAANAQVSFKLCPKSGTSNLQGRQIDIALTGRPAVSRVGC